MISDFSEVNKPSSKVLRPPGGGSSDIFGADMPSTPRNVKNHMQSNIFSCEKNSSAVKNNGGEPRRGQKVVDSYTRLFGEPERPFTPARNHMKSNIQFGGNNSQDGNGIAPPLANGNGHHHHVASTNGKSGGGSSVSSTSASSSVSSSTENLKMNGLSKTEIEENCGAKSLHLENANPIPCADNHLAQTANEEFKNENFEEPGSARSGKPIEEPAAVAFCTQTRRETSSSANHNELDDPLRPGECCTMMKANSRIPRPATYRNPISGHGMGCDSFEERPRRIVTRRDGNPVTGEGYKPSDMISSIPSLNGANQVINKNRIPPGGFSSGLW